MNCIKCNSILKANALFCHVCSCPVKTDDSNRVDWSILGLTHAFEEMSRKIYQKYNVMVGDIKTNEWNDKLIERGSINSYKPGVVELKYLSKLLDKDEKLVMVSEAGERSFNGFSIAHTTLLTNKRIIHYHREMMIFNWDTIIPLADITDCYYEQSGGLLNSIFILTNLHIRTLNGQDIVFHVLHRYRDIFINEIRESINR